MINIQKYVEVVIETISSSFLKQYTKIIRCIIVETIMSLFFVANMQKYFDRVDETSSSFFVEIYENLLDARNNNVLIFRD